MTRHSKDCRFQVLFVSGQIDERDDLGGLLADSNPVQVAVVRFVDDATRRVETQNVVTDRTTLHIFTLAQLLLFICIFMDTLINLNYCKILNTDVS